MADYVVPLDVSRQIADSLTAADALFDGAKVAIYTNNVTPTGATKYADLTQATFTGGATAKGPVVWGAAFIGNDGFIHLVAPSVLFVATADPSPTETVYGALVIGDPSGTPFLIAAWKFPTPVQVTVKYDGVAVDVDIIVI